MNKRNYQQNGSLWMVSRQFSFPFLTLLCLRKKNLLRRASSYLKRLRYASKLVTTFRYCSYFVTSMKSIVS